MRVQHHRVLMVLFCLAFGFGLLGVSTPAAAADKKKAWASKKHKKTHHKASKPAAKAAGSAKAAAPAEEADDDEGGDDAEAAAKDEDTKAKPKAASSGKAKNDNRTDEKSDKDESSDDDERQASKRKSDDDDDEGSSTVVHRKAKRPVMEGEPGALIALEVAAGPRAVHRSFDYNDPLSNHLTTVGKPYGYQLKVAPAPFVNLGFYPAAFATRGLAAGLGIVGSYEKIVGTQSPDVTGTNVSTVAQQFEVGLRGRLPLAAHEVGVSATYGQQTFHVNGTDPGPGSNPMMPNSTVPNVDYTFVGLTADARLRFSPFEIGAHIGTREVLDTGSLNKNWFSTVKTQTIDAGVSLAYRLTPMFDVLGGVDLMRYAFNFNPNTNTVVAGGAVDQYISGYLALRVSLSGG
jgi:hypothetical protein